MANITGSGQEVRIKAFDITFGELINLYRSGELVISPDYQRLFRWSTDQRSRLIESILLGLPIPQIFTIETNEGPLELIDGLQRVSTVIHFLEPDLLQEPPFMLSGCDLLVDLNGKYSTDLETFQRLSIKRTAIRTVVIERTNNPLLRYEMFKRLNTGGSELSPQEIRNCTARMVGEEGQRFYDFVVMCSNLPEYKETVSTLPIPTADSRGEEELVLRFFAAKNARHMFRGSVRDWLDEFQNDTILGKQPFDYEGEEQIFRDVFGALNQKFGSAAFVRFRNGTPVGALAPAYFEAVSIAAVDTLENLRSADSQHALSVLSQVVSGDDFRRNTGPGANSLEKLNARIHEIRNAFLGL